MTRLTTRLWCNTGVLFYPHPHSILTFITLPNTSTLLVGVQGGISSIQFSTSVMKEEVGLKKPLFHTTMLQFSFCNFEHYGSYFNKYILKIKLTGVEFVVYNYKH